MVGQRVVVRRLVPGETGPSGGPAMTDALGTCLAWDGDTCVVQPRVGDPITIPIADIVSGKPVPPRPSVRMRVPVAECEAHTASLFPGLQATPLAGWTIRWEPSPQGRPRKRANSCLAVAEPDRDLPDALDAVTAHYTERDRTPLVQVELGSDLEMRIAAHGWEPVPGGDADFLVTSAAMLRRELRDVADLADLTEVHPHAVATVGDGGSPEATAGTWARARAALDGDWLGIHDVWVDPYHRRQGLARALMAELLDWGAEQGARTVWLHVETDNVPAQALYESLGFTRHHTCRYLAPGQERQ